MQFIETSSITIHADEVASRCALQGAYQFSPRGLAQESERAGGAGPTGEGTSPSTA
jgi:hypothetical protein